MNSAFPGLFQNFLTFIPRWPKTQNNVKTVCKVFFYSPFNCNVLSHEVSFNRLIWQCHFVVVARDNFNIMLWYCDHCFCWQIIQDTSPFNWLYNNWTVPKWNASKSIAKLLSAISSLICCIHRIFNFLHNFANRSL